MTYTVTGANLFGQWLSKELMFSRFRKVSLREVININFSRIRIIDVNWSYNIFQIDNNFYVSGAYKGLEKQFAEIDLPEECKHEDILVAGNDYELVFVSKKLRVVWAMNFDNAEIKKFNFINEVPVDDEIENVKKMKKEDNVVKLVVTNNTFLFLTSEGNVYTGIPPSHLDTQHCVGKVCDIQSGYEHCVLLTDKGRVYTWGNGRYSWSHPKPPDQIVAKSEPIWRLQLGHGELSNLECPTEIEALAGIKIIKISVGGWHSLALSEFGDVYAWGWNDTGQLGIKSGGPQSYSVPTVVDLVDENGEVSFNVRDIACGSKHSAILLENGTVWTTGFNKYGQLGISPENTQTSNFTQSFQCSKNSKIKCGPWSTIVINK